jgi:uncharacterized repeat protein (TIGR01451 family)
MLAPVALRGHPSALAVPAVLLGSLVFAASAAAVTDDFYPNTTADTTNGSPNCAQGAPAGTCSLRDAVGLASTDSNDAEVVLASNQTYTLTQGATVFITGGATHTVTIEGFDATIDASGDGNSQFPFDGVTNLNLNDLTLTGAQGQSFLIYETNANLAVNNVTFTNNTSTNVGAPGLDVRQAKTLTLNGVHFTGNHGDENRSLAGLEVRQIQSSATLSDVKFDHNAGSALLVTNNNAPVALHNVVVTNNSGAIDPFVTLDGGVSGVSVNGLDIEGNATTDGVTPLSLMGSFSELDDVTIAGNSTAGFAGGGAQLNLSGSATAINWTVSGNQLTGVLSSVVPVAGGIDVTAGSLRLNHATIADNSAGGNADDLRTVGTGTVTVLNSIVAGSSASGAVPCAADGGPITSGGHNIDLGASCGFSASSDLSNTDPKIGPLTSGRTPNVRPLLYGSPAVDAADSLNCPPTDVAGTVRPQSVACDIGSVEAIVTNLAVALSASVQTLPVGGGQVTYTLTVSNLSANNPQDVQLTDALPAGAHFISADASAGSCAFRTQVTCDLGSVHRGANVTVTIVATLATAGANVDSAHVQSELPDSDMTNDSAQTTTEVAAPRLALKRLRVTPQAFVVRHGHNGGALISYVDSAGATTTLTFSRHSRHGRHKIGVLTHSDHAGPNSLRFSGKLRGHPLAPGKYSVSLVATLNGFVASRPVTATFRVER